MQNKSLPERTGNIWSKEEDAQLLKEIKDGINLDKISEIHKRTRNGIYCRKKTIATQMYESGYNTDIITNKLSISNNEYLDIINEFKNKNKKNNEKRTDKIKYRMESISTINIEERLNNMEKKIDIMLEKFTQLFDTINTSNIVDAINVDPVVYE